MMGVTPEKAQEALDYFKSYLDEGHNPRSNLSICLWGAPETGRRNAQAADIAITSVTRRGFAIRDSR